MGTTQTLGLVIITKRCKKPTVRSSTRITAATSVIHSRTRAGSSLIIKRLVPTTTLAPSMKAWKEKRRDREIDREEKSTLAVNIVFSQCL